MDLVLVRLAAPADTTGAAPTPQIVADILWATSIPDDRLEHLSARQGPTPETVDLALFHRSGDHTAAELALRLCRRAARGSPALAGWTAELLQPPDTPAAPTTDIAHHRQRTDPIQTLNRQNSGS